jgi:Dullard-like phosphatase family protein
LRTAPKQFTDSYRDGKSNERSEESSVPDDDASVSLIKKKRKVLQLPVKSKQSEHELSLMMYENEMKSGADIQDSEVSAPTPPRIVMRKRLADGKLPSIRMKSNSTDITKATMNSNHFSSAYNTTTVPGSLNYQQPSLSSLDLLETDPSTCGTPFAPNRPTKQFQFSNLPLKDIHRLFSSDDNAPKDEVGQGLGGNLPQDTQTQKLIHFEEEGSKSIWTEFKRLPCIQPTQISIPRDPSLSTITGESIRENSPTRAIKLTVPKKISVLKRSDTVEIQEELDSHILVRNSSIDQGVRKEVPPLETRKASSVVPGIDTEYKQRVSRWMFSKNSLNSLPKQDVLKHIEHMKKDWEEAKRFNKPAQPLNKVILSKVDKSKLEADKAKKFLVLDLDETLVSAKFEGDSAIQKIFDPSKVKIAIRPFASEFLREMAELWNIIVFTASDKKYADHVVDLLDPECKYIANVCYRNQCEAVSRHLVKDLRSFYSSCIKEENILIVDNRIVSFGYQIYNGIPILPFNGDMRDSELRGLKSYLKRLAQQDYSIPKILRERYRYSETFKAKV